MIYNELTNKYLQESEFSNGGVIKFKKDKQIVYRDDLLVDLAKNKTILHIGFVDHIPLINEKIERGNWLHQKIIDASNKCYGIDINREGIEYIKTKFNIDNLYVVDVTSNDIPSELLENKFDYIFIPDVIEHIGNPVYFLTSIYENFKDSANKIVLTAPNAFGWNNFKNSFKSLEIINTDHRFWFTPYTLSKIVADAGYKINRLNLVEHGKLSKREIFKKYILNIYPAFRDTIVIEIEF